MQITELHDKLTLKDPNAMEIITDQDGTFEKTYQEPENLVKLVKAMMEELILLRSGLERVINHINEPTRKSD